MRRFLLPLLLLSVCLLLAGCTGGVAPIVPPIVEPDPEPVYNGEPTQLVVRLERSVVGRMALRSSGEDTAYIRIEKKEAGYTVYRDYRKELLSPGQTEITLPFEIPADQGYEVHAHTYRGDRLLGVTPIETINAPAGVVTTATLQLIAPTIEIVTPDVLYSGGDLAQIQVIKNPPIFWLNVRILYSLEPWDVNPSYWHYYDDDLSQIHSTSRVPRVTEPTRLYYQIALMKSAELNDGTWEYSFLYFPDLSVEGSELYSIWIYPDPFSAE